MEKKSLKGTKTLENLIKAFAGESMARNKYTFFASIAKKEGYKKISEIFLQTADNEKEHAEVFYNFINGEEVSINNAHYPTCIGNTIENLKCAVKYEADEAHSMYPEFGKIAKEEGFEKISDAFYNISKIEEHHSKRYQVLLERVESNMIFKQEEKTNWICSHCGYMTENKSAPKKCPVCEHNQSDFEIHCDCL